MWTYRPTHVANRIKCTPGKSCESDRHTDMWRKSTFLQICKRNALSSVSLVFILLKEEDISSCSPRPTLAHLSHLFWNPPAQIEKYSWTALSGAFLIKNESIVQPYGIQRTWIPEFSARDRIWTNRRLAGLLVEVFWWWWCSFEIYNQCFWLYSN